jgi:hypothetical protein
MINNEYNNNISILRDAIEKDKLVIFAGAGISSSSGIPLWKGLSSDLKSYFNDDEYETDALKIAQILYNEKGEKAYNDIVKHCLFKNKKKYNKLHEIILELKPQHLITTNFDTFFEDIIKKNALAYSVVSKDIDLPYSDYKNLLVKYHGDFENLNIVFKENDYLEFSKNHPLKEIFVKSLFSNKIILFIGYSVNDINIKYLIREIQYILKEHKQRAYFLTHKTVSEFKKSEIKYFENLGINIICLDQNIISLKDPKDICDNVYQQLTYLKNFNLFEYKNRIDEESHVSEKINKYYKSLLRFDIFDSLPPNFMINIYPFKNYKTTFLNDFSHGYYLNEFSCKNEDFFKIIWDYQTNPNKYNDSEKEMLQYIIVKFVNSGIYSLSHQYPEKPEYINLFDLCEKTNNCNCLNCLVENYKYDDLFTKLESYHISEITDLKDDLLFAFSLYKTCQYTKAYFAYNDIIIKANNQDKIYISFIAKFNIYNLKNYIINSYINEKTNKLNFVEGEKISDKISAIDIDEEFDKVKLFEDEDMCKFLKEVKDFSFIHKKSNLIDELLYEIQNARRNIEKGDGNQNSNFRDIYNHTRQLVNYATNNYIIFNKYIFSFAINKFIFSYIEGLYINKIQNKKIYESSSVEKFDYFVIKMILNYSFSKDVINLLEDRNITIPYNSEEFINNYKEIISFLNLPEKNKSNFNNILNTNTIFKSKIKEKFENIILLLIYVDFDDITIQSIYSKINYFLENTDLINESIKNLKKLFYKKSNQIGMVLLKETIEVFNSINEQYIDNAQYYELLRFVKINEDDYINININFSKINFNRINAENFETLYNTTSINNRNEILQKYLSHYITVLDSSNILVDVYILLIENIKLNDEMVNKYIEGLNKIILKENFYLNEVNKYYSVIPVLHYIELLEKKLIKIDLLKKINIKNNLLNFIVNPNNYPIDKIDVLWFEHLNFKLFLKRIHKNTKIIKKIETFIKSNNNSKIEKFYLNILKYNDKF